MKYLDKIKSLLNDLSITFQFNHFDYSLNAMSWWKCRLLHPKQYMEAILLSIIFYMVISEDFKTKVGNLSKAVT